jgi:hypothetical protein
VVQSGSGVVGRFVLRLLSFCLSLTELGFALEGPILPVRARESAQSGVASSDAGANMRPVMRCGRDDRTDQRFGSRLRPLAVDGERASSASVV